MKFSITGSNGFIGVHLIHHLLKNNHEVCALKRATSNLSEFEIVKEYYPETNYDNFSWVDCDLNNPVTLDEVLFDSDIVVHLAGNISYLQKDLDALIECNVETTKNVVNSCLRNRTKKFIYCSSIAALSKNEKGNWIDENAQWDPSKTHSNYGYTKYLGECETWRAKEEGLDVIILNPGIVLGYGRKDKGSNSLFKNALTNFPFYSEGVTGFIDVEDVAKVISHFSISPIVNEQYIVISENKSYLEIANEMAMVANKKPPKIAVAGVLFSAIKMFVWIKEFLGFGGLITKETTKAAVDVNYYDNQKLKDALPFNLNPINICIENALKWYKKTPDQ